MTIATLTEAGVVISTLELVAEPDCEKACSMCCFKGEFSCIVIGVLPCKGGYWRLNSK